MECNKDEAVRARQMAEARMQRGEFVEALRFAAKAKKLYADVENITQILTVCEVHNAAHKKLSASADMDWYAILQIEKLADEAVIKKQYRRLALLLHPDKNKFAGAEAAFKLIGQANGVLSDRAKRSSFDKQFGISARGAAPKATAKKHQKSSETHHNSDGNVFTAKYDENATNYQNKSFPNPDCFNNQVGLITFWTSCVHCNSKYQYCVKYVNANLLCQQCLKPFKAHIVSFGQVGVSSSMFTSENIQNEAPVRGPSKPDSKTTGGKPLGRERTATFARSNTASMKKCAAGVDAHCKGEKSKDGCVPVFKGMESQSYKNVGSKRVKQSAPDSGESFKARTGDEMRDANVRENDLDPSRVNARRSTRRKQHVSYVETSEDDDLEIPSKTPRPNEPLNADDVENKNVPASNGSSNSDNPATSAAGVADQNREKVSKSKEENCSPVNSNVPSASNILPCFDADFNDFEKDKEEDCFAVKQMWAVYDNFDSMPRFYAIVKKVISPFELQITWLEPDPDDKDELDWHHAHFPISCGKFRLGRSQKISCRTAFSHQVQCVKETGKRSYLVCPNKGETWAIFRDWDIKWSSNPKKRSEYDYEYVEILSDFSKDVGIAVAYLRKVKGFLSLLQKTGKNGMDIFYVGPNELYRFSHQIPSYKMTGDERKGVPRGSFEFDPAALPTNFFEAADWAKFHHEYRKH
ncbi:unnamed protein product [Sphenostylis stenocarpa]|uniref:J domain-containing protein n=1 Tax=Sphenostylis stenocarpa TaxID=92480 RepID=A0AA86TRL6_9FABA|nr:unnamed protein product [Sphenostylis stenocarpa]